MNASVLLLFNASVDYTIREVLIELGKVEIDLHKVWQFIRMNQNAIAVRKTFFGLEVIVD